MSLLNPSDVVTATRVHRGPVSLYLELTKARLSALVLVTTAVGFVLAPAPAGSDWVRLVWTLLGTALAAGGANALNQLIEVRRDALMRRTRNRPLPSGAMGPVHGFVVAMTLAYSGVAVLALAVNLLAAALAALTILVYVGAYTPLKTRTTLNTLVGAVCGAIPPMIGWAAATGRLGPGAWVLAAVLFVWQIPHFFALAVMYRDDYARGGFSMLPVRDATGRLTGQVVLLASLCLIPLALSAALFGLAGLGYAAGSVALGGWLAFTGARLYARPNATRARRLFVASIIYLPLLLGLMVADRGTLGRGPGGLTSAVAMETPVLVGTAAEP